MGRLHLSYPISDHHRRVCRSLQRSCGCYELTVVTRQQALLDRAAVCLRLLRDNTSNPDAQRMLESLRELWKELALEIWHLEAAEAAEQLKSLSDVQTSVLAEMRLTLH